MLEPEFEEEKQVEKTPLKEFRFPKAYVQRLKRHQDAVLTLYSPDGINGSLFCSGSADERLRVWDLKETKISKAIPFGRPSDDKMVKFRNMVDDSLPRFPNAVDLNKPEEAKGGHRPESQGADNLYMDGPLKGLQKRL